MSEYEVTQDPYRGMGFLNDSSSNNGKTKPIDDDDDDNETKNAAASTSGGKRSNKIVTPWDACQWGILCMPKSVSATRQEQEILCQTDGKNGAVYEDDSIVLAPDDPDNLVRNLTESCCPSILEWTKQRLEEETKKKQQSQKIRKQRSSSGRKRNRSSSQNDENNTDSTIFAHLGLRPSDTKYRCPCDSNPFCLASLGGSMNVLLKERCQRGITVAIRDDEEDDKDKKEDHMKNNKRARNIESNNNANKNQTNLDTEMEILDVDDNTKNGAAEKESEGKKGFLALMGRSDTLFSSITTKIKNVGIAKSKNKTTDSLVTVLTCTRLDPRWSKPVIGDPAEVFAFEREIGNQSLNETDYSQTTKDEIDKLRGYEDVDLAKIKINVQNIFELSRRSNTESEITTIDEYVQTMVEWHKSLIFVNPTKEERDVASNNITIALPPGIQNLGATCYLNTQLQCLAQNPVFLDGIFSWRPVNVTHKMNGVMTKLQKLLGQLLVGGDGKYTSLDFSDALGIQHNEQQDPNEFARLLFDRMEESFQQCSTSSDDARNRNHNGTGRGDLSRLLQRIFHGTTTYETICMKCGNTSVRSEGFMDLNLPIIQRQPGDEEFMEDSDNNEKDGPALVKRKGRKGPIETAFRKQRKGTIEGTDVQYCFDQYTETEILDGDNQYLCEVCESKQDAKRVMTLTELPPVLNIQLSRYVFDREKFIKKKLMDKVSLPTVLFIDRHGGGGSDDCDHSAPCSSKRRQPCKKKYLLCAVMRHQGTSAYSGHYVAEAMDWTTGQWYEFNDETVTMLPAPSCSFIPDVYGGSEDGLNENATKSEGSQDAYNMYYVDEGYLGKHALVTMSRNHRLNSIGSDSYNSESVHDDILSNLMREKVRRYSVLTQLCTDDYAISDRLRRRKDGIRKYMFGDPSSLLMTDRNRDNDEPYFWVDGKTLRQFLACDRSLDEKLGSDDPIMCCKSMLCPHGYLDPRNARQGKLLRKSIYDSYKSLLAGERKLLSTTTKEKLSDVIGCVITSKGMTCAECSKAYSNKLSKKLQFMKNVNDLYVAILDETTDSTKNDRVDPSGIRSESAYSYVVSRSAISKFKKLVVETMKSVADFKKGGYLDSDSSSIASESQIILNGIDDLDISSFPGSSTSVDSLFDSQNTKNTGIQDSLDEKFNSKITCSHGNCNDFNLRKVRCVPHKTWAKIKKVFPDAVEHKVLMYEADGKMRKPNIDNNGCVQCREEKNAINNLTSNIERWAKETRENFALKKLLDGKKISEGEIAVHNFVSAQSNCRLVHRDDIANLCKSVKLLGRLSKLKTPENVEIKSFVENLAFPSYHSVVLDFEKQPSARLLQSIRSLICCEHKRVIKSAIIDVFEKDEELQHRHQLSNGIAVLSDEEYNAYINALTELLIILNCDYRQQENADDSLQRSTTTLLDDVKNFAASCHPAIKMTVKDNTASDEILLFSLDGNSKEFSIVPGICENETCKKDFVPLVEKTIRGIAENVSDDSLDSLLKPKMGLCGKKDCRIGSIAMSPIVVESDLEDFADPTDNTQKIRVFQYKEDSELNDAIQSLRTAVGLPNTDEDFCSNSSLRRSTRKRKVKFPVGCITREQKIDIGLHHNVAALRLLLYQNCQVPLGCKLSVAVCLDDTSLPQVLDIAFDWSKKTLNSLVDELKIVDDSIRDLLNSNASDQFFVLYQIAKESEREDIETTIMDSLLQVSNLQSPDSRNNSNKKEKARKPSSERGFQGTLLQSSTSSGLTGEKNISNHNISCCESEGKPNRVQNRPRSNTIISDDEIDETQTRNKKEEGKAMSDISDGEVTIIPSSSRPVTTVCSMIGDDKKMNLVSKLKELTKSNDESVCFEAISWAIKSNPTEDGIGVIIDSALAKFLDMTST